MPIGIKSYGAYLPKYMLPRELISKAWEFPVVPGTKAIAMFDEDSLTMAVEAGLDCIAGIDPKTIDGLYFASTTQVYTEKDSASLIATILDMREDIITTDFTDSLKAGTTAVTRAVDTIKANKDINSILVIASDTRVPEPSTMWEYGFADGAAALLISDEESIPISIEDYYSVSANVTGPWKRAEKDKFIRTFEVKMDAQFYIQNITKVMAEILKRNNLKPEDINIAAYYYDNPRLHGRIAKMMKFGQGVAQNSIFFQIGNTGTPMAFMVLIAALRRPKEEDKIIMASFGDGADAILMQVKDRNALRDIGKSRLGFIGHQKSMSTIKNYNKFLDFKELLEKDRYTRKSSAVTIWRDTPSVYKWYGVKCKNCGTVQYPDMLRSCAVCRVDDQLEPIKLQLKGTIFTYTLDHLVGGTYLDVPVPRCVIDLDGGGRVLLNMTEIDRPEENVKIGMRVELTFRKEHEGAEFKNYYWKCRPERGRK
ncbi:MAG: OB-fold domain-containing protein [Candidatus Heimdallarchaeota archaeon]